MDLSRVKGTLSLVSPSARPKNRKKTAAYAAYDFVVSYATRPIFNGRGTRLGPEPTNVDHVPPKLFFPEELRKGLNLLTIPTHSACNEAWRLDEEYFVHTLMPFARGTRSGDAAIRQSLRKYKAGRNVPLINMVMDEFKHVVGGVHLPANRVAKLIDANRFHDVLYKIIRGLHFHHTGEILAPNWSINYTVTAPNEKPPDFFIAYAESGRGAVHGKHPDIFAYSFAKFPEVNDLHFWAFRLWENIIITAVFHDMNCVCEYCSFVGPRKPEPTPGHVISS